MTALNKRSHTSITENAIHRNFDVQYVENIWPNFSMYCTPKLTTMHLSLNVPYIELEKLDSLLQEWELIKNPLA